MQVGVVAVDRVDVLAQPDARVDEPHLRGRRVARERRRERARLGRLEVLLEPEEAGRLGLQPPVDPAGDEPVVVVARGDDELALRAERLAEVAEHRLGQRGDVALGPVAQLDPVAEDHEPVRGAHGVQQRGAKLGPAQEVRVLGGAEVQVGDDDGPHLTRVAAVPQLEGILVADFSRVLAGPFATMLLGDLGADVIKVERPDGGDDTRAWGPPWLGADSTYYLTTNRNKRSVALDLSDEGDRALARTLALRADVLVESFRPG